MFGILMRLWAWYAGETADITQESGLAINDSLMSTPLEASEMAQLVNLYSNGLMSRKTVLDELQRGGVIDPDLVVDDEIERIEEDREEKIDQQIEEGEIKLEADLHRAEEFQKQAPNEPGQGENTPSSGQSSEKKGPNEQEKTAQAAKVAQ